MLKKRLFSIFRGCSTIGILSLFIFSLPRVIQLIIAVPKIQPVENLPEKKIGIIFGAGITKDGRPTAVLKDRVMAGVELYEAGKIQYLLMSGDNRFEDYNEPLAMKNYAIELGIPEEVIFMDFAGRRTYDTCYRAKYIFGIDKAILITQKFHLPRAIFLATSFDMDVVGYASDIRVYRKSTMLYWNIREIPAAFTAFWDVYFRQPLPVLGEYEPIINDN
ncbi:MAG: YdcF family protein [Anaerolineaceae bacterium]|nr:YdcF family protein [Anaerolineaceae bacterium]